MKRVLAAVVMVRLFSGVAEARPARPRPTVTVEKVRVVRHPIPHEPRPTFVGWVVNKVMWPAVKKAVENKVTATVGAAVVAAL
jgi:hypothetical protein